MYRMLTLKRQGFLFLCATFFAATQAQAAPQLLALIATDQPVALQCDATRCFAELPSLCLQPERSAPQAGRAYRLAQGQSVMLTGRSANGVPVSIPIAQGIEFAAARTHVAVAVSIPHETVRRLGLTHPAIQVGDGVTMVPAASAHDNTPQSLADIAQATGYRRLLATEYIDRDDERMPAVRLTNQLINLFPAHRQSDLALGDRLWKTVIESSKVSHIPAAAIKRARFNFDLCRSIVRRGDPQTLPGCLKGFNDDSMEYMNTELESALKAGS